MTVGSIATQPETNVATRLDRTDWTSIAGIGGVELFLHVFGW
ncbi:MAG: hypothetical protein QOK12_3327, partial [Mycobacterium sp.]|nr:hypothetical protein [Mycobacterium sp.]